jgi:hypothetical protein
VKGAESARGRFTAVLPGWRSAPGPAARRVCGHFRFPLGRPRGLASGRWGSAPGAALRRLCSSASVMVRPLTSSGVTPAREARVMRSWRVELPTKSTIRQSCFPGDFLVPRPICCM